MPDSLNNKGYTLVEIMIAITIGLFLIAAASATFIVQNRNAVTQESVSETNTQSKIATDMMAGELISAGFGTPEDLNEQPINDFKSIITPVDSTTGPDAITIIGAFRLIGTLWPAGSGTVVCPANVTAGSTDIKIVYNGTDGPNLTDRAYLSIDGIEFAMVTNCTLDAGRCESDNITIDHPLTQNFPLLNSGGSSSCDAGGATDCVTGRPVYLVEDTTYCVDSNLTLRRIRRGAVPAACTGPATSDNEVIAENIEDLQIAYALDVNSDGLIDDQNADGDIDSDDFLNGAAIADPSTIKAFRINFLARSDKPDINFEGLGNPPTSIENRNLNATNDAFRRRWWRTVVTMRNQ